MVVEVAFPVSISGLYDYRVPQEFEERISEGVPVHVELRNRKLWGVVIGIKSDSEVKSLKSILDVKTHQWGGEGSERTGLIKLYRWISSYYHCYIGQVFKPLVRKRFMNVSSKKVILYKPVFKDKDTKDLNPRQSEAFETLYRELPEGGEFSEIREKAGLSRYMVSLLCKKGFLRKKEVSCRRESIEHNPEIREMEHISLTEQQIRCVERVKGSIDYFDKPFLLHGVTGSGKTHVYIELAKECISRGKSCIILVPEIALTPQTIKKFECSLGNTVAVIHSRMSQGERRDSIESLVSGEKMVVVGVRSAIMIPVCNPGIIIVDEEHESSYKQSDTDPRYHARDVAVMRGRYEGCPVVLGSATPSIESYYNALQGKYCLLRMDKRYKGVKLPDVHVVNMSEEFGRGNMSIVSGILHRKIQDVLNERKKVILLFNRRGYSASLICEKCGKVYECPNCSLPLKYHAEVSSVKCHVCGYEEFAPERCISCGGEQIKYRGAGIQKAQEYIEHFFPDTDLFRMDQDTTRRKGAHMHILDGFGECESGILLGTQMVAKGLDFPDVNLVGVLQADTGLNIPDFRASERVFQLLTQVAGRAGRTKSIGEVVVQTMSPKESGIRYSVNHDYEGFYEEEIENREVLSYPPFGRLLRVVSVGWDISEAKGLIQKAAAYLKDSPGITLLGPVPAPVSKMKGKYRFSILLKSLSPLSLNRAARRIEGLKTSGKRDLKLIIDIDPVNML
ncbi:MAG: replication restart helicase PriA [Chitinivibrionales bacterium]